MLCCGGGGSCLFWWFTLGTVPALIFLLPSCGARCLGPCASVWGAAPTDLAKMAFAVAMRVLWQAVSPQRMSESIKPRQFHGLLVARRTAPFSFHKSVLTANPGSDSLPTVHHPILGIFNCTSMSPNCHLPSDTALIKLDHGTHSPICILHHALSNSTAVIPCEHRLFPQLQIQCMQMQAISLLLWMMAMHVLCFAHAIPTAAL